MVIGYLPDKKNRGKPRFHNENADIYPVIVFARLIRPTSTARTVMPMIVIFRMIVVSDVLLTAFPLYIVIMKIWPVKTV